MIPIFLFKGKHINQLILEMNEELVKLNIWFQSNKLSLNIKKTHYIVFHRSRRKYHKIENIIINNNVIEERKNTTFLGVIIDTGLTWADHVSYVKNKVSNGIGIINKVKYCLNKSNLISLYNSFIYPYLIYCVEIWGCTNDLIINPLFLLQKRIIRIITFSHYLAHTNNLFIDLHILPFKKLVHYRIGILMYKCYFQNVPNVIKSMFLFNHDVHNYYTRNRNLLHVPMAQTEIVYRTFKHQGVYIWNDILIHIDVNVSFVILKKILYNHISNNNLPLRYLS